MSSLSKKPTTVKELKAALAKCIMQGFLDLQRISNFTSVEALKGHGHA